MKKATTPADTLDQVTDPASHAGTPSRTMEKTRARVDALRPHPRNPRKISPARLEQLQRTLAAEPEMLEARPLIALPDGTVVAGNQRLAAARALGWETVPVVFADLDEAEVTRWMLLDNRGFGEDDREAVAALLGELEAAGSDLTLTGYDVGELDAMLRELHRPVADPDAAPPTPAVPRSRLGEVYELGPHRLICGDATDEAVVAELMAGETAAVMVTDPPYGVGVDHTWREAAGKTRLGTARGAILNDERFNWEAAYILTDAPVAYVWHSALHGAAVAAGLETAGFEVRQQLVWVKAVFAIGRAAYQWKHETCWYAVRRGASASWMGGRKQSTVIEASSPIHIMGGGQDDQRTSHPTQKPVAVIQPAIANHTVRNDVVYDPFAGSGTVLVAAEAIDRRAFMVELDPGYCDVIRQRYADYTSQPELAP